MKDNYSWLDDLLADIETENESYADLDDYGKFLVDRAKQTIISQIEIEKLRARIDEGKKLWGHAREHTITDIQLIEHQTGGQVDFVEAVDTKYFEQRQKQLQEKLKELEK